MTFVAGCVCVVDWVLVVVAVGLVNVVAAAAASAAAAAAAAEVGWSGTLLIIIISGWGAVLGSGARGRCTRGSCLGGRGGARGSPPFLRSM